MTPDVLALGRLVWEATALYDRLPEDRPDRVGNWSSLLERAREVRADGGGTAANVAATLARRGRAVTFVGRVGDDPAGRLATDALRWACVDVRVAALPGRATPRSLVLKEAGTDRTDFLADVPPRAVPPLDASEVPADLVAGARLLLLDRVSAAGAAVAARRAPGTTVLDLHDAPRRLEALARLEGLLPLLGLVQVRGEAAGDLAAFLAVPPEAGPVAAALAARAGRAVVTLGADGAVACERGAAPFVVDPVPVPALVDSTGAGDAFLSRLVEALLDGTSFDEACRRGARAGAEACGWLGARPPA